MDSAEYYGIKMRVWTMNTEAEMLNLMSIGVDMIATDYCHEFIPFQKTLSFYNVVGCWDFNENSGTILTDNTKYNNNGSITSEDWTSGADGGALNFTGSNYVTIPQSSSLDINNNGVSVSAWVNLNNLPSNQSSAYGGIYNSNQKAYVLFTDKGKKQLVFQVTTNNGTLDLGIPEDQLDTLQWMHVTGVYNEQNLIVYLNGKRIANANLTGTVNSGQVAKIGEGFHGKIDEVRVYSREITADEVSWLSHNFPTLTYPVITPKKHSFY
jgi:hypothetical protein